MLNRFFIAFFLLGLIYSCGEATQTNTENEILIDETTISEQEIAEGSDFVDEPIHAPEVPQGQAWQIDNYVDLFLDGDIADTQEANENWYYMVKDVKGGFASVQGPIEGWKEFALWRMKDGNDLIGEMTVGCGPVCDYDFIFRKGQGESVVRLDEKELFPLKEIENHKTEMVSRILEDYEIEYAEDGQLVYNLPQKGTGMQVDVVVGADEIRAPILKLSWDGMKFNIEERLIDTEEIDQ